MKTLTPLTMGKIVSLMFFYKNGFDINPPHKGWYAIK